MDLHVKDIAKLISVVLIVIAVSMLIPAAASLCWHDVPSLRAFGLSILICGVPGAAGFLALRKNRNVLTMRDSLAVIALSWIFAAAAAAVPYLISGTTDSFISAFFEFVSALTTTGATDFANEKVFPQSMLFWRSFCQWLGGAGILVLLSPLLRYLNPGAAVLMKNETPGYLLSQQEAKATDSAKKLYLLYICVTLLQVLLYIPAGIEPFDAMTLAFATAPTAGRVYATNSIAAFGGVYTEIVSAVSMIVASLNFVAFSYIAGGNFRGFLKNTEIRVFFGILAAGSTIIVFSLICSGTYAVPQALRYGIFHSVSFLSTTGVSSVDISGWPSLAKTVLTMLTFIGGCSMSTAGALKIIRIVILWKLLRRSFTVRLHPSAVESVRVSGKVLNKTVLNSVVAFFFTYAALFLLGVFVISFESADVLSAFTSSAALLNNIGSGFGQMGLDACYSDFSGVMKLFMCLLMLAGRLELYAVILFFNPKRREI